MSSPLTRPSRGRARVAASLTAAAGLIGAAAFAAVTAAPAQSAAPPPPAEDCATPADISALAAGDTVNGLTVSKGTTPDPFTGEVLGVLESGIAPGLDMVVMEFDSPAIDGAGGIWQGMSGSPVYDDATGDLIGAVAYGMSYGPSPIAGVTPFADMEEYLAAGAPKPGKVKIGKGMARKIAASSNVSEKQAEQGMRQLKMPFGVSGLSPSRLAKASHSLRSYLPKSTYVVGRAADAGPETVIAGGNIAASVSYGDINQAGVGTATSVCDGGVVGFGHPMTFGGETTMSLHPAEALYVQPDSLGSPYKVANLGVPAGVINEDHLTGITGLFGDAPDGTEISSSLTYRTHDRTGSSFVTVPDYTAGTTFYQLLGNHDRVVDAIKKGSETQSWTIEGVGPDGQDFSLSSSDRYVSTYDISFDASYELADIVSLLSTVPDLTIETVSMTGAVTDDISRFQVSRVEQFRKGAWTRVSKREPATVRGGKTLKLRAVLTSTDGAVVRVPFEFKVNKRLAGSKGFLFTSGGNDYFSEESFYELYEGGGSTSLADVEKLLAEQLRNDEVLAQLSFFPGGGAGGGECRGCRAGGSVTKEKVLGPVSKVVSGFKQVKVLVKP